MQPATPPQPDRVLHQANRRLVTRLVLVVAGMFAFGFALVPLYDVFCDITGLNGKTGRIAASEVLASSVDHTRVVTVQFVANLNADLPFDFAPVTHKLHVNPGEVGEIVYQARNLSDHTIVARAVPSVAPARASRYFNKIECFCFTEQTLEPGTQYDMPARFVVDPDLPAEITTMTLSYTFFATPNAERTVSANITN